MAARLARTGLAAAVALLLAACAGPAPSPVSGTIEEYQIDFGEGTVLDFEVERKMSAGRTDACYGLFSGMVTNTSDEVLSQHTILDFKIFQGGKVLFRDITQPLADIPPKGKAGFKLFTSPVHRGACPAYDRIDVSLRPPGTAPD